jgi:hypothetical protein
MGCIVLAYSFEYTILEYCVFICGSFSFTALCHFSECFVRLDLFGALVLCMPLLGL